VICASFRPRIARAGAALAPGPDRGRRVSLAWPRLPAAAEVALIAAGYLGYALVRLAVKASHTAAFAHAAELWRGERAMHLDIEPALNHLTAAHPALAETAGYYYGLLNFLITPLVLAWLYLRRRAAFGPLRSALVLSTTAANLVFWTWPAAPPRFAVPGMTDVLDRYHILGAGDPHGPDRLVNLYAAMPSLHVAWAAWCAAAVVIATRGRRRHLAWLYPAATTFVVLATANHFVLDAAAGLAVMTLGLIAAGAAPAAGWRGSVARLSRASRAVRPRWSRPGQQHTTSAYIPRSSSDGYGHQRTEQDERAEGDVVAEAGPAQSQQYDGEQRGGHEAGERAGHQRAPAQPAERGADAGGQLPIAGTDAGRADEEHDQVEGREPGSGEDSPAQLAGIVRGQSRGD
jgi:PAP2 superfamily protein